MAVLTRPSRALAGRLAGSLHSSGGPGFVELVVLMALGFAGRVKTQRQAAEENYRNGLGEAMDAEAPALAPSEYPEKFQVISKPAFCRSF
jgi:hypothetical protein